MSQRYVFEPAARLSGVPLNTVWSEMTPLAIKHKAINLGQGFPNYFPTSRLLDNLRTCLTEPLHHQYCKTVGHQRLMDPLMEHCSSILGRSVDVNELMVTAGVAQGLALAFQALINPGDEVVTLEPAFDVYTHVVGMMSGKLIPVPLTPSLVAADDWSIDEVALRAAVTSKTKAILLNNPMNVPGKVLSDAELAIVASIATEHNLLVISDEVYYKLVYDGKVHKPIASLPGMAERTVSLWSAGKTMSCTGWKIGWAVAPPAIIRAMTQVSANQTFCIATPLQVAVGATLRELDAAIGTADDYYAALTATYEERRDLLCGILSRVGLTPIRPSGGYFVVADIAAVDPSAYLPSQPTDDVGNDWHFCRWLTTDIGVGAIPVTAFVDPSRRRTFERFVRFAICKEREDIIEAGRRMEVLKKYMRPQ